MLWLQTSVWWPVRTDGTTQEAASQNCDDVSLLLWSGRARNNAAWINRFGGQDCDCGVLRVTQGGEFRQRVFSRVEWWVAMRCEKTNETMCTSAFSFIPYMRNCRVSENWHANIEKDEKQLTKFICILLDVEASGLGEIEVDWQIQQIYKWGQGGACGGRW